MRATGSDEDAASDDAPAPARADLALIREAVGVLEANWTGEATRPGPVLYPHQWSWDAAFVAMGYAHFDQERAQQELRSLFRGQWSNGMLPHIVFTTAGSYFPGPDFWQTERSPYAPRAPRTSGIIQPPLHATAARHIYRRATDRRAARAFLEELMPRLAAWHAYLYRERVRGRDGLVEIWHPWESGMDNSPLWDGALARLRADAVPPYHREDLNGSAPEERPTDADYDRYVYLATFIRDHAYRPDRIRAATPFAVQDVLYNSLLVQANMDLAEIAQLLGADPGQFEEWAVLTAEGIERKLWDEERAIYLDYDLVADEPIRTRVGAGFSPLYAGIPTRERARQMVARLTESVGVRLDETTWAVPSVDPGDEAFRPTNYWRGPIWINVNWVLYRGLRRYGFHRRAESLRRAMIELPRRSGFFEHYDPLTGRGHGSASFAWTAALVLHLLFDGGGRRGARRRLGEAVAGTRPAADRG